MLKFHFWLMNTSPEPLPPLRGAKAPPLLSGVVSIDVGLPISLIGGFAP